MAIPLGEKKRLFKGEWLDVWATNFSDKLGKQQHWEWVNSQDFTMVFPIKDNGDVVLIKNYRIPVEGYVLELPAGSCDKPGETLAENARRELLEETGYAANKFRQVYRYPRRAGLANAFGRAFIATGLKKAGEVSGDGTEDIVVVEIPAKELVKYCLNLPQGEHCQPEVLSMFEIAGHLGYI